MPEAPIGKSTPSPLVNGQCSIDLGKNRKCLEYLVFDFGGIVDFGRTSERLDQATFFGVGPGHLNRSLPQVNRIVTDLERP